MSSSVNLYVGITRLGEHDVPCLSARRLHAALKLKVSFAMWIAYQVQLLSLENGKDYKLVPDVSGPPEEPDKPRWEYLLTYQGAKDIAALERGPLAQAMYLYLAASSKLLEQSTEGHEIAFVHSRPPENNTTMGAAHV